MTGGDAEELVRLEHDRCDAISRGDVDAVAALLDDDLTHTHIRGNTEDKAAYLAGLRARPRTTTRRDDLRVRVFGDVAVMTGTLANSFPAIEPGGAAMDLDVQSLQVWVRGDDGWKQVAFGSSGVLPR